MPDPAPRPSSHELNQVLFLVMERITEFLDVERSTLFLYDEARDELWTPVAQGTQQEIRIPARSGIAGHVFTTGEIVRITDAYADPRFHAGVDKQTGFRTRDIFARPLNDSTGRRIGVIQLINRQAGPLTPRDEKLLDAICNQAGIAIENARLFLDLKQVHESERTLHGQLEANHAELRRAFLQIEESAAAQELLNRRMQKSRLAALLATVALFVGIGLFAWLGGSSAGPAGGTGAGTPALAWHTVGVVPVRTGIVLLGQIEPLEVRNLTAPLRGRIAEKHFAYGELVVKDQLLARLDTSATEVDLRNAEAAHFRAVAELRRLEDWPASPEVARARRNLLKAQLNYEANKRNLAEMEQLSKLGIIAQSSLDGARQQFVMQESDFKSAEEELANVLATATEDRVTVARYEVANSRLRLDELRDQLARAKIYAPFSGIVILPNARPTAGRAAGSDGFFEAGSTIGQGEILVALGNLEGVAVKTRADEADISRIRHGQPVRITGDAFPGRVLQGRVEYVSSQAITAAARPYFEILVKTGRLSEADLGAVRLGMTAKLDITVYETLTAVVAPIAAVRRSGDAAFVYRQGKAGAPEKAIVQTGAITPDSVEILSGLAAGDVIATDARAVNP